MSTIVDWCQQLSTYVNNSQLMSTDVNWCQQWSTEVNNCRRMSTVVNLCQQLSTDVNVHKYQYLMSTHVKRVVNIHFICPAYYTGRSTSPDSYPTSHGVHLLMGVDIQIRDIKGGWHASPGGTGLKWLVYIRANAVIIHQFHCHRTRMKVSQN